MSRLKQRTQKSSATFSTVLRRALDARPKVLALTPVVSETPELLARAVREGKHIPPDIEERMRHDREMAERKAENDH